MSCAYHRETIEITGIVSNIKIYNPPLGRRVFGKVNVVWFKKYTIKIVDIIYRLYEFEEQGNPETHTKGSAKEGDAVKAYYSPVSKRTDRRGCLKEIVSLS